jgi:UDPglucose 6-dehydrogenase
MNIGWFGLGKLGMPCAEMIVEKGHSVTGYDISDVTSELVTVTKDPAEAVLDKDFVFVAVQTPHDPMYGGEHPITHLPNKDFGLESVKSVLNTIQEHATDDTIIVLISTVLPGTTRREFAPLIKKGRLIYNPYLIAMGTVKYDMVNPDMVIIGGDKPNDTDANKLVDFYKTVMENDPHYNIGTWEEGEGTKIFYNTFISARLSLVNMIQDVAERVGNMNVDVITESLSNAGKRITSAAYMKAGMGDGGPCHPRDNIALRWLAEELDLGYNLFDAIAYSREIQAKNMAQEIIKYGKRVGLTSISYKNNVDITTGSYALLVKHYLEEMGADVTDEVMFDCDVILRVHENDDDELNMNLPVECTVFDPWRSYTSERKDIQIIYYGNTRQA